MGLWSRSGAAPVPWDWWVLLIAWSWGSQLQNRDPALPLVPTASSHAPGALVPSGLCYWQLPLRKPCAGALVF